MSRIDTYPVKIGNITIGHQNKIYIQSMCNIKTSKIKEVISQINELTALGADLMRVSIMDEDDARAVKEIKKAISIPLVGDVHFDYHLAILAMENGIDKIRINPGNIGSEENMIKVIKAAKKFNVAIRLGVNSGSLDKETLEKNDNKVTAQGMVNLLSKYINICEKHDFFNVVLSLKASDVPTTIEAYRLASAKFNFPLHLGVTETGVSDTGIIRSIAGLAPLVQQGIGDTIRISLSDDPKEEIIVAKRFLHDMGLYPNYPTLISCPTCGRTCVDVCSLSKKVLEYLEKIKKPISVAVMGCIVNGPGEAKHADIGLAGGKNEFVLFKKGQILYKVKEKDAFDALKKEIESL